MHKLRALVLDDDDFMLEMLQSMLHTLGVVEVQAYPAAEAALQALDMDDPLQVAICDLNMPGMDGIEFLRHLAGQRYAGAVIVLSGEDGRTLQMVEQLGHAHKLRLLGALAKPVDLRSIAELLEQVRPGGAALTPLNLVLDADDMRAGLAGDAVVPVFQPQVEIATRRLVGVEALARWQHPQHGLLGPAAFIDAAEECDLIVPLTEIMLRKSLQQWQQWQRDGLELGLSVNVSMRCLSRLGFPDWIVAETMAAGMPLERLLLEITESRVMQDAAVSLDVLSRLCLKRIQLSIDDFGTAYSNMEKLQTMPFRELKIDRAFVHGATQDTTSHTILEFSAALGRRLGMRVVAEGVETRQDWNAAARFGCDVAQGYYIARPMPGDQLLAWARQWERRVAEGVWGS